jgi:hypothetical protein
MVRVRVVVGAGAILFDASVSVMLLVGVELPLGDPPSTRMGTAGGAVGAVGHGAPGGATSVGSDRGAALTGWPCVLLTVPASAAADTTFAATDEVADEKSRSVQCAAVWFSAWGGADGDSSDAGGVGVVGAGGVEGPGSWGLPAAAAAECWGVASIGQGARKGEKR